MKKRKLLFTALTLVCAGTLVTGTALAASADGEDARERVYTAKYDEMFEDFDRADLSNTVTANGSVQLGEKPYLHVVYTAGKSTTAGDAIYKQGSSSLQYVSQGGSITITMRAPQGGVSLGDLIFAVRSPSYDKDEQVVSKSFTELYDKDLEEMPALTAEWQTYQISFSNTYESDDKYDGGNGTAVSDNDLAGIHIYAAAEAAGTIDIASITYETGGEEKYLNDFLGGETVDSTAKISDSGVYWAGSSEGYIVKREPVLSKGGQLDVVRDTGTKGYEYAYIVASGDTEHLSIATTTDGTQWSTASAYATVFAIQDGVKGFRFVYDGDSSVALQQIFLTNFEEDVVASAIPVIDAENTQKLEDFNVSQTGFNADYSEMSTTPQMAIAGLEYRLSYSNADKVSVSDGALVFDATNLGSDDYINFKFASKTYVKGDYIVLKVKAEDGATLDGFRFKTVCGEALSQDFWNHQFMAGYGLPYAGLDKSNPYVTEDGWYYLVINLEATGYDIIDEGYNGLDLYYSGSGVLKIDEIFFANEAEPYTQTVVVSDAAIDFVATDAGYQYAGYVGSITGNSGNVLAVTVEIAEGTDMTGIRFEFDNGTFFASKNDAGTMYLTDGSEFGDTEFVAGEPKTVYIDLAASGIVASDFHVHTNGTGTGNFKLTDITLLQVTALSEAKVFDEEKTFTMTEESGEQTVIDFKATGEGYQYGGYMNLPNKDGQYDVLALTITVAEGTDLSGVRLGFNDTSITKWFSENAEGILYTTDGKMISELEFTPGVAKTIYIDLAASGLETFENAHVHTNGTATGNFKIENIQLLAYKNFYAEAVNALPVYETPDAVAPSVSITTGTTATVGDTVTVSYTASDDVTADSDLQITVTVKKDGEEVALTNNAFTAEEGVYTVTVTVRDEAGNENSDTIQITVSKAGTTDPGTTDPGTTDPGTTDPGTTDPGTTDPGTKDPDKENTPNLTALWIVLGVAAVVIIAVVVVVVIKKKKNK